MMSLSDNSIIRKLLSLYLRLASRGRYVIVVDFLSLAFAVYLGYALRLTFFVEAAYLQGLCRTIFAFSLCILLFLVFGGTYKTVWPRASIEEYTLLCRWYAFGMAAFLGVLWLTHFIRIPRSSLSIMLLLGIMFLTASRAMWKLAFVSRRGLSKETKRALVIGAGEAGALIARDLLRNSCELHPIGFIDDNPALHKMSVASLPVLGTSEEIRKIIISEDVEVVLIATPSATGEQIKKFVEPLEGLSVTVRILPSLLDLADGNVGISRLRSVSLEDLLRREPIKLDTPGIETLIKDKTVLVTGAGGSIGSEICRQVLAREPKELVVLGHGEQSIYLLLESLNEAGIKIPVRPVIADVADIDTITSVFERYRPQLVFHAAAHKHVPLMEENPREALRVNAFGTWNLAAIAGKHNVERMVMISTDKAVHPTSVMGATKRAAERLLLSVQQEYPNTHYMAVRFGNVLGSRGSVVPKFEKQIENGGPVTVTHKDMKRYFMLIPEAVSLVLQAGAMGDAGSLFVLDMGEPVNITEMAETLIRLHGHEPYRDIQIKFTGIRPGEKLYEELFYDPAHVDITAHEKIFLSKLTPEKESILPQVKSLLLSSAGGDMSEMELKGEILALGGESRGE